jgi:hypothetical protein
VEPVASPCYIVCMPRAARHTAQLDRSDSLLTDTERADLLSSLEASRAEYAAGRYHVVKPGVLRKEFEAALQGQPSDEDLDALLGIVRPESH